MNTNLNIHEIEYAIARYDTFNFLRNDVLLNISWGFLYHEADMLIISKSGYLTEIEIKRTLSDIYADFKKKHTHSSNVINSFYYAVPESLLDKTRDILKINNKTDEIIYSYLKKYDSKTNNWNIY